MELQVTVRVDDVETNLLKIVPDEAPSYVKLIQLRNMTIDVLEHIHMEARF